MPPKTKDCDICYTSIKINARSKSFIKCYKCEYEACMNCYVTYMNQLAVEQSCYPKCMKCSTIWDYTFIIQAIPDKYRKEFARIRSEVLFSLTKSLLPAYTERFYTKYKLHSLITPKKNITVDTCRLLHDLLYHNPNLIPNMMEEYKFNFLIYLKYTNNTKYLNADSAESFYLNKRLIHKLRYTLFTCCNGLFRRELKEYIENKNVIKEEIKLNIKCLKEGCNGFINEDYECYICYSKVCKSCEMLMLPNHECNESDVENLKLIKKECISCPNCNAYIYKIYGCDQMWCTNCNTAFDWKTRKILDTKNFHNPHYIDYIRSRQQSGQDVEIEQQNIACNDNMQIIDYHCDVLLNIREMFSDFNHLYIGPHQLGYRNKNPEDIITNSMKYINNDITETQYKKTLQMIDKRYKFETEIADINQVLRLKMIELYNHYAINIIPHHLGLPEYYEDVENLIDHVIKIIDETNKMRDNLFKIYKYKGGLIRFARRKYPYILQFKLKIQDEKYILYNHHIPGVIKVSKKNDHTLRCSHCYSYLYAVDFQDDIVLYSDSDTYNKYKNKTNPPDPKTSNKVETNQIENNNDELGNIELEINNNELETTELETTELETIEIENNNDELETIELENNNDELETIELENNNDELETINNEVPKSIEPEIIYTKEIYNGDTYVNLHTCQHDATITKIWFKKLNNILFKEIDSQ